MTEHATTGGLAEQLRTARRWAGITQEQLAGLSTVSVRAIRDLERGRVRHPRGDTIRLLADAMRLCGARRAELEFAVEGASAQTVIRAAYGAELVPPPRPVRGLVGRSEELRALSRWLTAPRERLLSVVGLAGVGKTRLAQEAALLLHTRDRMPVLWVDMTEPVAPVDPRPATRDPRATLTGWARSLAAGGDGLDELAAVLHGRATLLVLDGYDSARPAPQLLELLRCCEDLKLLITSREPLTAPGNRLLPLAPLPVGDPDALTGESSTAGQPAVELMLSHVCHMRPDLLPTVPVVRTVARLCWALDGHPRAMESAASWLLLHPLDELLHLARSELLMISGETACTDADDVGLATLLEEAVGRLDRGPARLLAELSTRPDGWTTGPLSVDGAPDPRDLHALLVRGLIRRLPDDPAGTARFSVLHLVRQVVAARGGAVAVAA